MLRTAISVTRESRASQEGQILRPTELYEMSVTHRYDAQTVSRAGDILVYFYT